VLPRATMLLYCMLKRVPMSLMKVVVGIKAPKHLSTTSL